LTEKKGDRKKREEGGGGESRVDKKEAFCNGERDEARKDVVHRREYFKGIDW